MRILKNLTQMGPGFLVTAAFIGPGTVTTCTLAGAGFGYALIWGLLFSVLATIILQEMTVRLGIIGRQGLGEALRNHFEQPMLKYGAVILVISAILIGNAAYETGNILGASLGISEISGISHVTFADMEISIWGPVIGLLAFALLELGSYKNLEKIIISLVLVMSVAFVTTAIIIQPDLAQLLKGMFIPIIPKDSMLMLVGLIGTTVVPYNLFLHASTVREKWTLSSDLPLARNDLTISVFLGGVISIAIVITSASAFHGSGTQISGAADLAAQLEPLLGNWGRYLVSMGLFAAGISSAITAPLAAAYATAGILGKPVDLKALHFKLVWRIILLIGTVFSAFSFSPLQVILFAQFMNGLLLPLVAIFLLVVMNSQSKLGSFRNNRFQNIAGATVIALMLGLGVRSILKVSGVL